MASSSSFRVSPALGRISATRFFDGVQHLGAEVLKFPVPGFVVDLDDHVLGEVEDALKVAR
ncbi:hypothetical protein [Candidatus Amarobacter glycogenicus]|uniref:hypothetical protein n=1 Tax=Candidatus Amarobacter glycogenicus TaxID=3140699 RepID=UPI0031CC630B